MDGYINKPITCSEFNNYLERFINHKNWWFYFKTEN